MMTSDDLGRIVRKAWVEWALEQPNPKPSWLVPWELLSEPDKEADRRIGNAVAGAVVKTFMGSMRKHFEERGGG